MTSAMFFIRNELVGVSEVPDGAGQYVFLCRTCGEVWGRIVASGEWFAIHSPCDKHGTPYDPSFDMTVPWWPRDAPDWYPPGVRREPEEKPKPQSTNIFDDLL